MIQKFERQPDRKINLIMPTQSMVTSLKRSEDEVSDQLLDGLETLCCFSHM